FSPGDTVYLDLGYSTISSMPAELEGEIGIKTRYADRYSTDPDHITFTVNRAVDVFVAWDTRARALPAWMSGWEDTGKTISHRYRTHRIYRKSFAAGTVELGGQEYRTTYTPFHYIVMVVAR
ncbi:MAG: hypothetical protein ACYTAF_09340, partial [Planctomycetota bacterium]